MRFLGFDITRKAVGNTSLSPVDENRGGWWPIIRESFTGAWQQNIEVRLDSVLTYSAVYSCISLISGDIGKLRLKLMSQDDDDIWTETDSPAFSPVIRKPNRYQTRVKFFEHWVACKLIHGNTYILKQRDDRNVVVALYILDPTRVTVLVAPDGSIFYELKKDELSLIEEDIIAIPANEIIHDVMVPLYHPLVGVSPIFACGLAAVQGLRIQNNSANFFANGSRPSGVLTAPGEISNDIAARLKNTWETNFSGNNSGKVAVLGDGLKFEPMTITSEDAQLIDQLKWTAETVCSCFHVPPYMIGLGPQPAYNNVQALNQQYYTQCLQIHLESMEILLDEGLELPSPYGTEFDIDGLLRMDSATLFDTLVKGIGGGMVKPNEARKRVDLKPVTGGDTCYLQQQNFSLEALNKRDQGNPFPQPTTSAQPAVQSTPAPTAAQAREALDVIRRELVYV